MKKGEVFYGLSFEEYKKIDAVNFSSLKNIVRSPAYYIWAMGHNWSSKSMDIGRAVHSSVLEPDTFADTVVSYAGTKRGKAWDAFKEKNLDKEILTVSEFEKVRLMTDSVLGHNLASKVFDRLVGIPELSIVWDDPTTGIKCKARLDWVIDGCVYDLKTAKDPAPDSFNKAAIKYRYLSQFAFYAWGYEIVTGERCTPGCIAVGNTEPFETVVYDIDGFAFSHGHAECMAMLKALKDCIDSNEYPSVDKSERQVLTVPDWCTPYGGDDSDPFEGLD